MLLEGWVTGSVGCYGIIHILEGFLEEEPFEQGFYGPRPSWDGQAGLGFPTGASTQSLVWAGLLNSRLLLGKKPACGRQRGWYQRGWSGGWRGTSSTARHQLLSEPLLDRCKIRTCLSPALGFNFLNVSLKVLLTGHPRRAGFRQGGFLCVHMTQLPRARSCLPRALSPTPCSPFPSQGGAPHQPLLNRFPWALSRGIRQRAQPPSLSI